MKFLGTACSPFNPWFIAIAGIFLKTNQPIANFQFSLTAIALFMFLIDDSLYMS